MSVKRCTTVAKEDAVRITTPLTDDIIEQLHAGDKVTITGIIYVGRDDAHKRMIEALDEDWHAPT